MSELDNAKKLIRPIIFNTLSIIIGRYERALNHNFIKEETKKNIEALNKRIDYLEKYLEEQQKFNLESFALELGVSFVASIGASLISKKLFGSLDRTPFQKFNPRDLYMTDSTVGSARVGFSRVGVVRQINSKSLAYISDQNFTAMAKQFNKLVDAGNANNTSKAAFSKMAFDAFMSLSFATSQGTIQHLGKSEFSKTKSRVIDLAQVHKYFSDNIITYWNSLRNSLNISNDYNMLYVVNEGLKEFIVLWDQKPKGHLHKFQNSVKKMLAKYFDYATYVGLSGAIGGSIYSDSRPFRQKTYPVKASKNLFRTMVETNHYHSSFLNKIGKKAGKSIAIGLTCQMFNRPQPKGESSFLEPGTYFLVGFDYVLCKLLDKGFYVFAIRLTKFKWAYSNSELKKTNWTDIPPVKQLKYYKDYEKYNNKKFKKYIGLKIYPRENYFIDVKKYLKGNVEYKNFDQDIILNYMAEKTMRVTGKELNDIPKFNSYDNFVDLSLVMP